MIHTDLSALSEMSSYLIKGVDQVGRVHSQHRKAAARIEAAEARMAEFLERMNGEPFMALRKWLDECAKSNAQHDKQRREFLERERQLLARWKSHIEAIEAKAASVAA